MIFTVAIDGPAAAGKGTVARAVAARFGFAHLDTGLLYRAVGARAAAGEDPVAAARDLRPADLARGDLRSLEAGQWASRVAVLPEVRAALVDFQRGFARREGLVVARHGAAEANRLGLSPQVPLRSVWLSSGASTELHAGALIIEFKRAPRWLLVDPDGRAGAALR